MDIAIVRRNGLGDLLCAYPLILYTQRKFPEARITLFVDDRNAPLLPYLPAVHHTVVFPKRGNKYWKLYKTAQPFKNYFDMAISAKTSPMKLNNCFLYWLRAKERIAYVDNKWHRRLINQPLAYDKVAAKQTHQALKGLRTIAPHLDDIPEEFYPRALVPAEIKAQFPQKISDLPIILLSASINRETSSFSPARFASILNRLYRKAPFKVFIVGQKNDATRATAMSAGLVMENEVHFPRHFDEFMVLLDHADLFFVGDGGVAHIGAALGKYVLALYGQTLPAEWRPLSRQAELLYHPHHVNSLSDEAIFERLMDQFNEVLLWKRESVKSSASPSGSAHSSPDEIFLRKS